MKKKKEQSYFDIPNFKDIFIKQNVDEFEIGQSYDDKPAKRLKCRKCGSTEFIIGVGSYFTAIKCPKCKYERCIHDG